MGLLDKRRVLRAGKYSRVITIPAKLKMGQEVTLAANRLLLIDPRGEVEPEILLRFLEVLEPRFWDWLREEESLTQEG